MSQVALIILAALLGNLVFARCGLPGILGMIAAGAALGPSGLDAISPPVLALLDECKTLALIVILIRAGLGISRGTLNRIGGPALRMGSIPFLLEALACAAGGHALLGLPVVEAGMLGVILAAVSPALVVPRMLELQEGGFGRSREVPTLVLAGASLDNVLALTAFGVLAGLVGGVAPEPAFLLLGVPAGILLGAALGAGIGFALVALFHRHTIRDTRKVILFLIVAVVFYDLAEAPGVKERLPVAALLGIMTIGFVILERDDVLAHRLAAKFGKIWILAEILLFVSIGAAARLREIDPSLVAAGLAVLVLGLVARSVGVAFSLLGTELTARERLFCGIAYLPKATVQAALGAVPLALVRSGQATATTPDQAQTILALAVLAIVVTTPLGAIGTRLAGPRLLSR